MRFRIEIQSPDDREASPPRWRDPGGAMTIVVGGDEIAAVERHMATHPQATLVDRIRVTQVAYRSPVIFRRGGDPWVREGG